MWKGADIILFPENLGWGTYIQSHIVAQEANTTCPVPIILDDSESDLALIFANLSTICPVGHCTFNRQEWQSKQWFHFEQLSADYFETDATVSSQ